MNKITITGRLGRDSELRALPNGDPVLSFAVADDVGFGDKKRTQWFNCSIFGKRAQALGAYLKKGQQLTVFGSLELREWVDRDGAKRITPEIRVDEVALSGGAPAQQSTPAPQPKPASAPPPKSFDDFEDDIPF
jgi:single-strand DNA-binding protein